MPLVSSIFKNLHIIRVSFVRKNFTLFILRKRIKTFTSYSERDQFLNKIVKILYLNQPKIQSESNGQAQFNNLREHVRKLNNSLLIDFLS